jgi:hypothetical protein
MHDWKPQNLSEVELVGYVLLIQYVYNLYRTDTFVFAMAFFNTFSLCLPFSTEIEFLYISNKEYLN